MCILITENSRANGIHALTWRLDTEHKLLSNCFYMFHVYSVDTLGRQYTKNTSDPTQLHPEANSGMQG